MIFRARWLLPIHRAPVTDGWIRVRDGRIVALGEGAAPEAPDERVEDLGAAVILPGLVNAHTHLELSWMAGLVPPAASMHEWIRALMRRRRAGVPGGADEEARALDQAVTVVRATGTALVGDVSNSLSSVRAMARGGLGGVVFHELIGFSIVDAAPVVREARVRLGGLAAEVAGVDPPIALTLAAHAPYSVSPALFREIAEGHVAGPLAVHLGESFEEVEFLRSGRGPIREVLRQLGVWTDSWSVPACDPVEYLQRVGYLRPGVLAAHAVHLRADALERLADAGGAVVTCPRSNAWVGAGLPRVAQFYGAGLPVAIGTDSLASSPSLNLFDELAELRRIAPDVSAGCLLESATRTGAEVLGLGQEYGTLAPGKRAALIAVRIPDGVTDVEEWLVGGIAAGDIRRVA